MKNQSIEDFIKINQLALGSLAQDPNRVTFEDKPTDQIYFENIQFK